MEGQFILSTAGIALLGIVFLVAGAGASWLLFRSRLERIQSSLGEREADLREAQKAIHERDRTFLEERNRLEISNSEALKKARADAHEQGRQFGRVEGNTQHLEEIIALKADFATKLDSAVDVAAAEARRRLTAEYELQSKLFTVQINPYVRITENKGLFSSESVVDTGYQYQLLVNGLPTFQPHVIIERSEARKLVNEENIKQMIELAQGFAANAIETYLGAGGSKFAKLAPVLIRQLGKGQEAVTGRESST